MMSYGIIFEGHKNTLNTGIIILLCTLPWNSLTLVKFITILEKEREKKRYWADALQMIQLYFKKFNMSLASLDEAAFTHKIVTWE